MTWLWVVALLATAVFGLLVCEDPTAASSVASVYALAMIVVWAALRLTERKGRG